MSSFHRMTSVERLQALTAELFFSEAGGGVMIIKLHMTARSGPVMLI